MADRSTLLALNHALRDMEAVRAAHHRETGVGVLAVSIGLVRDLIAKAAPAAADTPSEALFHAAMEMLRQAETSLDQRTEFRAAVSRLHSAVHESAAQQRDAQLAAAPVRLNFLPQLRAVDVDLTGEQS